jgi:hypothetical protein
VPAKVNSVFKKISSEYKIDEAIRAPFLEFSKPKEENGNLLNQE